jgi:hypothetical protein
MQHTMQLLLLFIEEDNKFYKVPKYATREAY